MQIHPVRGSSVDILSLFRRKSPSARRAMTPVEVRARQAAIANAQGDAVSQAYRNAPHSSQTRARHDSDGRQAQRHAYLAAHGVEKSFGGRMVVKGVTLYVRRGEAVGLLGPNGAGKTTVFYMITGLINADRGRIELDGFDVTGLPMYQRARLGIGYLPQEASIFRGLNVEDNIRSVLEVVEPDRRRRETDLNALLEEFNIARLRKTPTIALSGGERRRVEIARALATRPSYMLLDEPFAGIDPIAVGDISRKGGGPFPPHATHKDGLDVDMRPLTNNGINEPTNIGAANYSHEQTRELLLLIRGNFNIEVIFFNDPLTISEGLTRRAKGHGNHLHVRFRA